MSDQPDALAVDVRPDDDAPPVDVTVDGEPFTSYLPGGDPSVLQKPALYPIRAPTGARITRGFPLDPRTGERTDHPHHIGHWLSYGAHPGINGVNFWNVSDEIPSADADVKGRIAHQEIRSVQSGDDGGSLAVSCTWERGDGTVLLEEDTLFRFAASPDRRVIDRSTTLTARQDPVRFPDDKEGMVAVRVARELEHPETENTRPPPEVVGPTGSPVDPSPEVHVEPTGEYRSAAGDRGTDVWGNRAEWVCLAGEVDGDSVAITIMDHPDNPGFPTYWHARGYGLFAANPLGQAVFSDGEEELEFTLAKDESATFRYRIAIDAGVPGAAELDDRQQAFGEERF